MFIVKDLMDKALEHIGAGARLHCVCPNSLIFPNGCKKLADEGVCKHGGIHLEKGEFVRTRMPKTDAAPLAAPLAVEAVEEDRGVET